MKEIGWYITSSMAVTKTQRAFQEYIQQSKGERSIAKPGYIMCNRGWFGERSLGYMATGKPVLLQDTGFTENFETTQVLKALINEAS